MLKMDVNTTTSIQMELDLIKRSHHNIEKLLDRNNNTPKDLYIPNKLFQRNTGMGQWVFNRLKSEGKLRLTKRGREIWVHRGDVEKYLNGEIQ